MKLSWNGKIVDEQEAVVSVLDHGFLYGVGCFETLRTYHGHPFELDRHLDRLERSCASIGIHWRADRVGLRQLIDQLREANALDDCYIRISVSGGIGQVGLSSNGYESPNVIVYMKRLPDQRQQDRLAADGRSLQLLKLRRNTPEGEQRLKTFHFLNNVLAKQELAQYHWAQGAEGLFLSGEGYVAEGIVSNVFFVCDQKLCTPAVDIGILPGITRALVMEMAGHMEMKLSVEEGTYSLDELCMAKEIFLTNSVQEIVPVTSIFDTDGRLLWKQNGNNDWTRCLQVIYRQRIKEGRTQ